MLEIILHIGMGKTGTSSIQKTLAANTAILAEQRIKYLGMWFDIIDPAFSGHGGQKNFFRSSEDEMRLYARAFLKALKEDQNTHSFERFIISNESIFANIARISPFVLELKKFAKVRIIVYARNPRNWLPSAYNQWEIYHKVDDGPIRPYAEVAGRLIKTYSGLKAWSRRHHDILMLRTFNKNVNIVDDFSLALGMKLKASKKRTLERTAIPEGILRLIYNNMFHDQVWPGQFKRAMGGVNLSESPSVSELISESFSYTETEDIIDDHRSIFDDIFRIFGVNLLSEDDTDHQIAADDDIRDRLLEHLLHLTITQAERIRKLEEVTNDLLKVSNTYSRKDSQ